MSPVNHTERQTMSQRETHNVTKNHTHCHRERRRTLTTTMTTHHVSGGVTSRTDFEASTGLPVKVTTETAELTGVVGRNDHDQLIHAVPVDLYAVIRQQNLSTHNLDLTSVILTSTPSSDRRTCQHTTWIWPQSFCPLSPSAIAVYSFIDRSLISNLTGTCCIYLSTNQWTVTRLEHAVLIHRQINDQ